MAGRGWTRPGTLALFVLSAALLGGCGGVQRAARIGEGALGKVPGRQFNSKLPFRVCAQVEEEGPTTFVGETPSRM
jgi:hypothetical protein